MNQNIANTFYALQIWTKTVSERLRQKEKLFLLYKIRIHDFHYMGLGPQTK